MCVCVCVNIYTFRNDHCQILTEIEGHANEDYEAKPGIEIGYKIDNGDDNVSDGGEDAEYDVAVGIRQIKNLKNQDNRGWDHFYCKSILIANRPSVYLHASILVCIKTQFYLKPK